MPNQMIYKVAYRKQRSGRISEIGGGSQSCSREQKHEGWSELANVRNYDIKSSQIWGLYRQFKEANECGCDLNINSLDKYLKGNKNILADEVGVSVDCWKGMLYGLFFGGFPKFTKEGKVPNWKKSNQYLKVEIIHKHICKELGIKTDWSDCRKKRIWNASSNDILRIRIILQRFYNQNNALINELTKWHKYLGTRYLHHRASYSGGGKRTVYITNKCDMKLELSEYLTYNQDRKERYLNREGHRKLASHILQGQEAVFIHYLTWYSSADPECPYRVLSNQHDGLVVYGSITQEYINRACLDTDFPGIQLVEKPFK
ncbi:MAG: hypothetical protein HC930_04155 [Hydrococcus sp. SU_1_0]|nr:hypothetical protein [Hydrococcus sp. SU_1_0]